MDFVTVFCKLPLGLQLTTYDRHEIDGKSVWISDGLPAIRIQGNSVPQEQMAGFDFENGGYRMNVNIPSDRWAKWYEQNLKSDAVKNELIFAAPKLQDGKQQAKANEKRRSGFERVVPTGDPRAPTAVAPDKRPGL